MKPPPVLPPRLWPHLIPAVIIWAVAVLILVIILAGCGSAGTSGGPPSAASVARQLGCTAITREPTPELYAYSDVSATCQGRQYSILTFRTDTLRDNWAAIASQYDGIAKTGHLFAVADGRGT